MMHTLQRVLDLPVGDKMIAYVGNFDYDIARCERMSPLDKGAPRYKQLLTTLQDGLRLLNNDGRIRVDKVERQHRRTSNRGKVNEWRDFAYEVVKLR